MLLALGIVLNIVGLGFFCWVLFTLAIFALPFFVGMTAGFYAHGEGAGPFGAIVLGILARLLSPLLLDKRSFRSCARRSCGSRSR